MTFTHSYEITAGTETEYGKVERVSLTAALINGEWVPFTKLVKPSKVEVLVQFS